VPHSQPSRRVCSSSPGAADPTKLRVPSGLRPRPEGTCRSVRVGPEMAIKSRDHPPWGMEDVVRIADATAPSRPKPLIYGSFSPIRTNRAWGVTGRT
jgi:hypothetical protein